MVTSLYDLSVPTFLQTVRVAAATRAGMVHVSSG